MVTHPGVRARRGRLLLLAALLLGIVTMHTLGHPAGEQHGGMTPTASTAAAPGHSTAGHGTGVDGGPPGQAAAPEHAAGPGHGATTAADQHAPAGHGMDPMAVCLAVLLAGVALALLAAAPLRPGTRPEPTAPRGPPTPRRHPAPPPPRALLSRLCLLRI
ncbi:hypothetical protein [Streptomyces luteolus]|uniref:Secreted protein n=1 Tax=Streptomyces luteolus TaxID=3043615 RepID=A0ABT6T8K7_9ACTN|nr:hypothetical protein [Streptomyces sp. B-S-A12]MDI3424211.1 hypothetical protein [Streptomyces sp. B-S-A12]